MTNPKNGNAPAGTEANPKHTAEQLQGQCSDVPDAMRHVRRWLVWRSIPQEGKKPNKVPYYANGHKRSGEQCSPADIAQLATFDDACAALSTGRYAGLGFALGPDGTGNHWQGIDLDDMPARPALQLIADDLPGYTETSPSGNGMHAIGYGLPFGNFASNESGVEAYSLSQFFTVTGEGAGLGDPECLADFVARVVLPVHAAGQKAKTKNPNTDAPAGCIPDGMRNATLTSMAGAMRRKGFNAKAMEAALAVMNADSCNPPLPAGDVVTIARSVARYEPTDPMLHGIVRGEAANDPAPLVSALANALRPFNADDYERASAPHPHAFMRDDQGLFPVGEATVVAAPGREGKTYTCTAILVAYALSQSVAGLAQHDGQRSAVIYSGEDDPTQYARKVLALGEIHGQGAWRDRIIVPDLRQPGISEWRALVTMVERRAVNGPAVAALIEAMRPMMQAEYPPGLVLFETASTLTEADEDGTGHRMLIDAVKTIASELKIAAVLVHHTSQQAASNLPTLNVSVLDIRGATQLVYNARQCLLLVSLGSDEAPHPEKDARTMLRKMVAPGFAGRVTALIPLDTSKAVDPPPLFYRWQATAYGPALIELTPPPDVAGKQWLKVLAMLRGQRAEMAAEAKDNAVQSKVTEAVEAAGRLIRKGRPASARAVSEEAGHAAGWADRYLATAVELGLLQRSEAKIPNAKGQITVYLLGELSDKAA